MDRLSPELFSMIFAHLLAKPSPQRPSIYSVVARKWQYAVDAHNFASLTIKSKELSAFARLFSGPRRRRRSLLRQLNYNIGLPTYGDRGRDHVINEAAFGAAVKSLIDLLESWDKDEEEEERNDQQDKTAGGTNSASLELNIWLSYDVNTDADGPMDHAFDVTKSSAARRYYTLPRHLVIPQVQRVTRFSVNVTLGRAPHPATLCQLAGYFPCLNSLDLTYWDPAVKRHEMRKEHRAALGNGLRALSDKLLKLERLCIRRQGGVDPWNHSFACGDLQEDGVDVLCDAIRYLAQTSCCLRDLELENIMISPDLFRASLSFSNSTLITDDQPPVFPHLRRLNIRCGILAPSGKWYYTGDPNAVEAAEGDLVFDDDDDSSESDVSTSDEDNSTRDRFVNGERPHHEWRTRPDPDTFDALVRDMTDAMLTRMPNLEWAKLEMGSELTEFVGVVIQCCAAGQPFVSPPGKRRNRPWVEDTTLRRCKAWVGRASEWDVPPDVLEMWREWAGTMSSVETGSWP